MYETTAITREQWNKIWRLDLTDILPPKLWDEAKPALKYINGWVNKTLAKNEDFVVFVV